MTPNADDRLVVLQRFLGGAGLALLMLFWTVPANAATPAFDLDLDSEGPSVEVTVRFQQTISSVEEFESSGVLDRLIGGLPADRVDEEGRPLSGSDPLRVSLDPVESGVTYQDSMRVDDGEWAFFPWPGTPSFDPDENPGAPPTEFVTVEGGSPLVWLVEGAVAVAAVALGSLLRSRTRKFRPQSSSRAGS
jgi:hypothetical protein